MIHRFVPIFLAAVMLDPIWADNGMSPALNPTTQPYLPSTNGRSNPFAPPPLPRGLGKAPLASTPGGAAPTTQPAVIRLPVLEGVVVRQDQITACFRVGDASFIVEPGAALSDGQTTFVFGSFVNNQAILRDAAGNTYNVRMAVHFSTAAPNMPKPLSPPTVRPSAPPTSINDPLQD